MSDKLQRRAEGMRKEMGVGGVDAYRATGVTRNEETWVEGAMKVRLLTVDISARAEM